MVSDHGRQDGERKRYCAHTVCADYTGALRFRGKVGSLTRPVETFEGFPSENSKKEDSKKKIERNKIKEEMKNMKTNHN